MKGCSRWMDAITDCVLGKTPEPDLAAHLVICPQCQDAVRGGRAMAARIDEALHHSAAVEPPLYGPERVMAQIQGQTDTRAWRRWAAVGSAVLAVLIVIVIVTWVRRPPSEADVTALSTWRSPTRALLRPPVAVAWTTTPRLGEGFFKIEPLGEIHAQ
jgi:anti-sigma factor RsiW